MNYRRLFIPNSMVFLTIVTKNRLPILVENIDFLKTALFNTMKIYKFHLFAYTIQIDHIHCIIKPKIINDYSNIIKSFKYSFSKNYKKQYSICINVWQNRFWEHTIRDKIDLKLHLDYIHYNSMKHSNISPKDWQFSSFYKFVKHNVYDINWCNFIDAQNITSLYFE